MKSYKEEDVQKFLQGILSEQEEHELLENISSNLELQEIWDRVNEDWQEKNNEVVADEEICNLQEKIQKQIDETHYKKQKIFDTTLAKKIPISLEYDYQDAIGYFWDNDTHKILANVSIDPSLPTYQLPCGLGEIMWKEEQTENGYQLDLIFYLADEYHDCKSMTIESSNTKIDVDIERGIAHFCKIPGDLYSIQLNRNDYAFTLISEFSTLVLNRFDANILNFTEQCTFRCSSNEDESLNLKIDDQEISIAPENIDVSTIQVFCENILCKEIKREKNLWVFKAHKSISSEKVKVFYHNNGHFLRLYF